MHEIQKISKKKKVLIQYAEKKSAVNHNKDILIF